MSFTIEKNVPMRNKRKGRPSAYRDALERLKINDSFFIPKKKIGSIVAQISRWGLILGIELACRTEGTGVRVHRTK